MSKNRKGDKRPFWTGDCETDPFQNERVPKPFIWGLWTNAGYHEFNTAHEFADFVRDCDVIVFFHNGGKFDFHFMLAEINLEEEVVNINGRLVSAHIGKCEIRDSYNILPVPLAAYKKDSEEDLRRSLEEHGCDPALAKDYLLMEKEHREKPAVMKVIRKYLKNDCMFLYELIDKFESENGRHLTLAGAALARWQKMTGLKRPSSNRGYFQKFANWYNGGRVECFQKGKINGPCNVYDIRSAYMWAMQYAHPFGTEYIVTKNPQVWSVTSFLTVVCVSYGALPYRNEKGILTFPNDNEKRVYNVCGHELEAAIETDSVRQVQITESIDFIEHLDFKSYVDFCHGRRMHAREILDTATDLIEKLFGNGLYGKWAANPDNYGNFICVPFAKMEDFLCPHKTVEECEHSDGCDGYKFDGMIGPHALLRSPLKEWQSHFLNIATAASITSMVRAKLWRATKAAKNPIYCDTDCIMCSTADLEIGQQLGQWQHEGTATAIYIAGKKMYLCEGLFDKHGKPKMATKGVKLSPQQIRNIVNRIDTGDGPGVVLYKPEAPTFSLVRQPVFTDRRVRMT